MVSSAGPGPFVTSEIVLAPDGTEHRWKSRRHRKQSPARRHGAVGGHEIGVVAAARA